MKKDIPYKITWTDQKRKAVCDELEKWMYERGRCAFHGEGIAQDDDCQIYAHDLIGDLVDNIIKPEYIGE